MEKVQEDKEKREISKQWEDRYRKQRDEQKIERKKEQATLYGDGFVRKPRQWYWFFVMLFLYGTFENTIKQTEIGLLDLITLLMAAGFFYEAINMVSSHVIGTWKHRKHIQLYIYIGCIFLAVPGILMYYYFKHKEKNFLKREE